MAIDATILGVLDSDTGLAIRQASNGSKNMIPFSRHITIHQQFSEVLVAQDGSKTGASLLENFLAMSYEKKSSCCGILTPKTGVIKRGHDCLASACSCNHQIPKRFGLPCSNEGIENTLLEWVGSDVCEEH